MDNMPFSTFDSSYVPVWQSRSSGKDELTYCGSRTCSCSVLLQPMKPTDASRDKTHSVRLPCTSRNPQSNKWGTSSWDPAFEFFCPAWGLGFRQRRNCCESGQYLLSVRFNSVPYWWISRFRSLRARRPMNHLSKAKSSKATNRQIP